MALPAPRADWTALALTPRRIPASTRIAQRVATTLFQMAALTAVLALFFLVPIANCDLAGWLYFRGPLETAPAHVARVENAGMGSEGRSSRSSRPILRYEFEFEQGGRHFTGCSYSSRAPLAVGAPCAVEYLPGKPGRARIRGMRSAPFGLDVLFSLFVPAMALGLCAWSQKRAQRALYLLERGEPARGRLLELVSLPRGRHWSRYWTARVEYTLPGGEPAVVEIVNQSQTQNWTQAQALAQAQRRCERGLRLLVDARDPARALDFDDLPLAPGVDEVGNIRPTPTALLVPYLIVPGLVLALYAAFGWWLATRA